MPGRAGYPGPSYLHLFHKNLHTNGEPLEVDHPANRAVTTGVIPVARSEHPRMPLQAAFGFDLDELAPVEKAVASGPSHTLVEHFRTASHLPHHPPTVELHCLDGHPRGHHVAILHKQHELHGCDPVGVMGVGNGHYAVVLVVTANNVNWPNAV